MAGVNLVKRLKEKKSGADGAAARQRKPFGLNLDFSSFGGGEGLSTSDKVRLLLCIASLSSIYFSRNWLHDHNAQIEAKKHEEIAAVDTQIATEKRKLDALKGLAAEADAFDKQMQELQRKLTIIESLGKNRNLAIRMVDFIVSEMPANIWLSKINLDTKNDSKVELAGNATSMQVVSEFMRHLEGAVFFPRWQLVETQKDEAANTAALSSGSSSLGSSTGMSSTALKPAYTQPVDTRTFQLNAKVVPL